jgi:hypothetical protein
LGIRFLIVTSVLKLGHQSDLKGTTSYKLKPSPFCLTPSDPVGLQLDFSLAQYLTNSMQRTDAKDIDDLKFSMMNWLNSIQEISGNGISSGIVKGDSL